MNIIWPKPGKYVVAVSGGVDSVCLLDMLANHGGYELVVAHVDHGIREDSALDAELVQQLAKKYQFNIVITKLTLSKQSSENQLRQARYSFLFDQLQKQDAQAILTAHHADDLVETSIMNIRRGTDRYGAAGGMTRQGIVRPLINVTKNELRAYALEHKLDWHEDSTNQLNKYTRNKIRNTIIPRINVDAYRDHMVTLSNLNNKIDSELKSLVSIKNNSVEIARSTISTLGLRELEVLLAYAIRQYDASIELSQPQIARLAREIMLDTTKNSFSLAKPAGIIIEIQ